MEPIKAFGQLIFGVVGAMVFACGMFLTMVIAATITAYETKG